jgi:tetratricopeptide (TPR) repeat protein
MHFHRYMLTFQNKRRAFSSILILTFTIFVSTHVISQILSDTAVMRSIRKGIDFTYGMHFTEARSAFATVARQYPDHPVNLLISSVLLYWENYPLLPGSEPARLFEESLRKCIDKCQAEKKDEMNPELVLTNVSARGMLLLYYTDNGQSRKVISIAPGTYKYMKRSFGFTSVSPDFYFYTGLYNYYREAYPEAHPIYKPIASLFPRGDKKRGIAELEISAAKSTFLKADSYTFLTWIFTNFEKDFPAAIEYNRKVVELYPANYEYAAVLIKNLIAAKRYDEADKYIVNISQKNRNPFISAQLQVLQGLIQEFKTGKKDQARKYYENGLSGLASYGYIGNEFSSLACYGLSRISEAEGDQQASRKFRRKADDLSGN